jgi:hypothetical protein
MKYIRKDADNQAGKEFFFSIQRMGNALNGNPTFDTVLFERE